MLKRDWSRLVTCHCNMRRAERGSLRQRRYPAAAAPRTPGQGQRGLGARGGVDTWVCVCVYERECAKERESVWPNTRENVLSVIGCCLWGSVMPNKKAAMWWWCRHGIMGYGINQLRWKKSQLHDERRQGKEIKWMKGTMECNWKGESEGRRRATRKKGKRREIEKNSQTHKPTPSRQQISNRDGKEVYLQWEFKTLRKPC